MVILRNHKIKLEGARGLPMSYNAFFLQGFWYFFTTCITINIVIAMGFLAPTAIITIGTGEGWGDLVVGVTIVGGQLADLSCSLF